jgi:hypothetical protein
MSHLHYLIDNNFHHLQYGRLLYHYDLNNSNILHYSVQVNDWESLAWEPVRSNRKKDIGNLVIWPIDWNRFHPAQWVSYCDKERIKRALHLSVTEFHQRWQYELYRFNCEHWARLVTTGDCRCYQITDFKKLQQIPILGVIVVGVAGVVTGAWEHNGYPQETIHKGC